MLFIIVLIIVDLFDSLLVEPHDFVAKFIKPLLLFVLRGILLYKQTVPLTIDKPALVLFLVSSKIDTEALLFVVFILSLVDDAISVVIYPKTMHFVVFPLTSVDTSISKMVDSEALQLIVQPFTLVLRTFFPVIDTIT